MNKQRTMANAIHHYAQTIAAAAASSSLDLVSYVSIKITTQITI